MTHHIVKLTSRELWALTFVATHALEDERPGDLHTALVLALRKLRVAEGRAA